jgi:hypothetical protein
MSSKSRRVSNTPDVYSFTTIPDDTYLERVIAEAKPNVNFILVTDKDTELRGATGAVLLVNVGLFALADFYPDLVIAGKTLLEGRELAIQAEGEWVPVTFIGDKEAVEEKLETVRQQIRAINNKLYGRTVKVTVESF